jgi:hypothetical protein
MKPGDFFLGVLDFFAVLLPGSLAAWLVIRYLPATALRSALTFDFLPPDVKQPDAFLAGGAFLLGSYLLGHFVFMLGSRLDSSYDRWRVREHRPEDDTTYLAARELRKKLTPELGGGTLTLLKWARAYIQVKSAAARPEIDRLEAEQKLFRSLVVIGPLYAAHFILGERAPLAGVIALAGSALSYDRYLDRRWAMTELIYATAVIVGKVSASGSDAKTTSSEAEAV